MMVLATLLVGAAGTLGSESVTEKPVTKVINLLKDMGAQLEVEQKEDEEVFEKFACWCESNDKLKSKAIADAKTKISSLGSSIEELTAKGAQLTTDIATLTAAKISSLGSSIEELTAKGAQL